MTDDEFLASNVDEQNKHLVDLAEAVLPLLEGFDRAYRVGRASVRQIAKFVSEGGTAADTGLYLNHPNTGYDLSAQFDFIDENPDAMAALDVITYATGAVGLAAYLAEGNDAIPEPIRLAKSKVVVKALAIYRDLEQSGKVPTIP